MQKHCIILLYNILREQIYKFLFSVKFEKDEIKKKSIVTLNLHTQNLKIKYKIIIYLIETAYI